MALTNNIKPIELEDIDLYQIMQITDNEADHFKKPCLHTKTKDFESSVNETKTKQSSFSKNYKI